MQTHAATGPFGSNLPIPRTAPYPVSVHLDPALEPRNRLTTAFRIVLAVPHLILVGGPIALGLSWGSHPNGQGWEAGGGLLGAVAAAAALIAWFALIFTGRHPEGLSSLSAFYLRWRVRAVAYTAMLRDEYPPFGEGAYPAEVEIGRPPAERNRVSIAFRIILVLPHVLAVWALGVAWAFTSMIAWFAILFTGRYPAGLYRFATGVLRWSTRVEAYCLLLTDAYPPFSLD